MWCRCFFEFYKYKTACTLTKQEFLVKRSGLQPLNTAKRKLRTTSKCSNTSLQKSCKCYNIYACLRSYQGASNRKIAQGVKWPNVGRLVNTRMYTRGKSPGNRLCVLREVLWILSIVRENAEEFRLGRSQFSCDIT